jgi:hypothetical protein
VWLLLALECARRLFPHPDSVKAAYYRFWAFFMLFAIAAGIGVSGIISRDSSK